MSITLALGQYPMLSSRIRSKMRHELYKHGIIEKHEFEKLVRKQAIRTQELEGLRNPVGEEPTELWEERIIRVRDQMTDLTFSGESLTTNAATCLAPTGSWLACRKHYAEGRDVTGPYISPLFGDLRGLPPLSIHAGGSETLRDDSTRFAEKARAAGVPVALTVGEGLCHCYPACAPIFPEASRAMAAIGRFIAGHIGA